MRTVERSRPSRLGMEGSGATVEVTATLQRVVPPFICRLRAFEASKAPAVVGRGKRATEQFSQTSWITYHVLVECARVSLRADVRPTMGGIGGIGRIGAVVRSSKGATGEWRIHNGST